MHELMKMNVEFADMQERATKQLVSGLIKGCCLVQY